MTTRITYWKEADGRYLGYLNDYPDHWTQGDTLPDLKDHLRDLFQTFSEEEIPGIRTIRVSSSRSEAVATMAPGSAAATTVW